MKWSVTACVCVWVLPCDELETRPGCALPPLLGQLQAVGCVESVLGPSLSQTVRPVVGVSVVQRLRSLKVPLLLNLVPLVQHVVVPYQTVV